MELVMPGVGVLFWTCIIFLVLFFILKKWAFPVINRMLEKREEGIRSALDQAEDARRELARMKAENENLMESAKKERARLLEEAHDIRRQLELEGKRNAKAEYERIVESARRDIEQEKQAVMEEIKIQVANVSVDMAEKILQRELSDRQRQQELIEKELKDIKL